MNIIAGGDGPLTAYVSGLKKFIRCVFLCFEDLPDDPYDPNESDPMKCRAIDSSLWELKVSFTRSCSSW